MIIIHAMNDNHSPLELKYKPRWIAALLRQATKAHPVVVLTGARQVCKSTLHSHRLLHPQYREGNCHEK
jgi:predicted AAA+ superfamily ATPase